MKKRYIFNSLAIITIIIGSWWIWGELFPKKKYCGELSRPETAV